jgi:hypothetical protein
MLGVLKPIDLFERWMTSLSNFNQSQWTAMQRSTNFISKIGHFLLLALNLFIPIFLIGIYAWYLIYNTVGFPFAFISGHLFKHGEGFLQGLVFGLLFLIGLAALIYIIIPVAIWIIQVVWLVLQFLWDTILLTWFSTVYFFQWIVYLISMILFFALSGVSGIALIAGIFIFFNFDMDEDDRNSGLIVSVIVFLLSLIGSFAFMNLIALANGYTFPEGSAGLNELVWKVISFPPQWLGPLNLYSFMQ